MKRAILDLRGVVRHCYYSGEPRVTVRNGDGEPVPAAAHAVHNFINYYLIPITQEEGIPPINIIGVLEGKNAALRRRAFYPGYKARRDTRQTDETEAEQRAEAEEAIQRLLVQLGAILMTVPFCEADDTIAYICARSKSQNIVYTVDFDLLALTSPTVEVRYPTKQVEGEIAVRTMFEGMSLVETGEPDCTFIEPFVITMYKSLVGDKGDDIKGVVGFGETKFFALLNTYGIGGMRQLQGWVSNNNFTELEEHLASQGKEADKNLKKILDNKGDFRLSYWTAMLHPEWCEQAFDGKTVRPKYMKRVPSREKVAQLLEQYGLTFHLGRLDYMLPYQWLMTKNDWDQEQSGETNFVGQILDSPFVAFDWETWDTVKHQPYQEARKGGYVDTLNSELTGASFCFGFNMQLSFYMPVLHRDTLNCPPEAILTILQNLKSHKVKTVAHNAAFECTVAAQNFDFQFDADNLPCDTLITGSHVNENDDGGLKKLSKAQLNYDQINYSEVVPAGGDMRDVSGEEVLQYGADDSLVTAHLFALHQFILECEGTLQFATEIEPFFTQALLVPFLRGIPIDSERLAELSAEDDVLFDTSDKTLRALLTEHCSQVNEEGFNQLWPEVSDFQIATMRNKEKPEAEIKEKIKELHAETYERCAYRPFGPPTVLRNKASVSKAAQSIGLPPIRSLAPGKIRDYYDNLMLQVQTRGVEPTAAQTAFLAGLLDAAPYLKVYCDTYTEPQGEIFERSAESFLFGMIEAIVAVDQNQWVGDQLNTGSSLQMAQLFYGKIGLPILIRNFTKNDDGVRDRFDLEGAPSTNEIAIKTWMAEMKKTDWKYQVLDLVLKLRAVRTRRQLYYKPYPLWKSPIDGFIHPGLRNCGTITRRPSGSSPNLLQVSKIKDDGKMRSTVLPRQSVVVYRRKAA